MATSFAQFGNELYTGKRSYNIVGNRKRWFAFAGGLVVLSILLLTFVRLNPGIEFRGGSEFQVANVASVDQNLAYEAVETVATDHVARVSQVGNDTIRVQTEELSDEETTELAEALADAYDVSVSDVTASFVGPAWGKDVTGKALRGLVIFLALVTIVMAGYFRHWKMSIAALIALLHDLVITVGMYAGVGFEVTPATVIGFLTIMGYSLYDTVVVFDKVRENTAGVLEQTKYTYAEAANLAVNQTLVRSINTSVVGLLPVGSILFVGSFLMGAGTLRDNALALFIGLIFSTLSSIFVATPIEVWLRERDPAIAQHTAKVIASRTTVDDEGEVTVAQPVVGGLVAGQHRGQSAQPVRKKGRRK